MNDRVDITEHLNPQQKEAVTHSEGPLLIIAGAGTGKTTVITRRIAWLISQGICRINEILALTFTDKAAREMTERVDVLLPYGYTDIWISTFHAFGDRVLRENSLIAGLDSDFKVLTRPESAVFFREHLFEFELSYFRPLADPTRFVEALITLFNRARDEDISASDYIDFAAGLKAASVDKPEDRALKEEAVRQEELARAYGRYLDLLAKNGLVDFGNQFYLALKLLREHPLILSNYQKQFRYILVDEFQDTNFAQFQIVKLLAGPSANITVVADDDQCIYRWRGAAYSNVLNFIDSFPAAKKVSLIQNYRSRQPILDAAYRLIQNNNPERFEVKAGIDKKLTGLSSDGPGPEHKHFDSLSAEADFVADTIKKKFDSGKYAYRDFAILVRSNSDAEPFLQSLNMQEIPWQFSGNQGLYARPEVKLCINFLRVIANPYDSLSLYYLASSEIYDLEPGGLTLCMHYARRRNLPLHSVFLKLGEIGELKDISDEARKKLERVLVDIDKFLEVSRNQTTGRLLYSFLQDTGYLKSLTRNPSAQKETCIQNIAKFFNLVRDFELVAKEDRVMNFVNYLNLLIEAGDDPPTVEADADTDAVNVYTIHKAKGLEFRVVFLVSLVNNRFPLPRRSQPLELPDELIKEMLPSEDFHLHEERRLFYVGMTRAKEELYLTSAGDYGGQRLRRVSQFVIEALGTRMQEEEKKKVSALQAIERFAPQSGSKTAAEKKIGEKDLVYLTYYQIDDYLTCPLKYKYVNILRVPIMEHHTVIYGRAMHDAVTKYFQARISGAGMELAGLLEAFEKSFDPQGFLDKRHQEERFACGREALIKFYRRQEEDKTVPLYIEKEFSFVWENNKIAGRFDRVDKDNDGVTIIDFKTSEISSPEDADKRSRDSLQLSLYAMAWEKISNALPQKVALYFLESGLIGESKVGAERLEKIGDKIREVSAGIRRKEFQARPTYMACVYCAYNQICPSAVSK